MWDINTSKSQSQWRVLLYWIQRSFAVTATEFLIRSSYEDLYKVFHWEKLIYEIENWKGLIEKINVLLCRGKIIEPLYFYISN